jgi:hypothetical protein
MSKVQEAIEALNGKLSDPPSVAETDLKAALEEAEPRSGEPEIEAVAVAVKEYVDSYLKPSPFRLGLLTMQVKEKTSGAPEVEG